LDAALNKSLQKVANEEIIAGGHHNH